MSEGLSAFCHAVHGVANPTQALCATRTSALPFVPIVVLSLKTAVTSWASPAAAAERIQSDDHGGTGVSQHSDPKTCNPYYRRDQEQPLEAECNADILMDARKRRTCKADQGGHVTDAVVQQGGVGGLNGDIGSASFRDPGGRWSVALHYI